MDSYEFVSAIKEVVVDNSFFDVIKNLSRKHTSATSHKLKYISEWYNELDDEGKVCVEQIIKESIHTSIFGIFCVLDGVRSIENSHDKGHLELYFVKDTERTRVNDFDGDFLHDIFNGENNGNIAK